MYTRSEPYLYETRFVISVRPAKYNIYNILYASHTIEKNFYDVSLLHGDNYIVIYGIAERVSVHTMFLVYLCVCNSNNE